MQIAERLKGGSPCFSFEFFPPKSEEGVTALYQTLHELAELKPGFVSVTYGAGGSTRQRTVELVSTIKRETGIEAMAHLTCMGHDRSELRDILDRLAKAGINNVLALRGDPPQGQASPPPAKDHGFTHATELLRFVRDEGFPFCLGAACYPEGHLESPSRIDDLIFTRKKEEAGARFLITQLFFDNAFYFHFV
jgi:methylenetetrahydrofolate reductase (NADPH)